MRIYKITLLLFLFINSLNADYLLTVTKTDLKEDYIFTRCIKEYSLANYYLVYRKSSDNVLYSIDNSNISNYTVKSGFYLDDNNYCSKIDFKLSDFKLDSTLPLSADNLSHLGLSDSDLNMMFSLSGILISSLFLFGLFRFI